jgi:hypothetical protein
MLYMVQAQSRVFRTVVSSVLNRPVFLYVQHSRQFTLMHTEDHSLVQLNLGEAEHVEPEHVSFQRRCPLISGCCDEVLDGVAGGRDHPPDNTHAVTHVASTRYHWQASIRCFVAYIACLAHHVSSNNSLLSW